MAKLTKRQQEILTLIQSHMATHGSPPTRAEIAKTMGFRSPNAAEDHLRALARKGVIELVPGTSRGIRLTQASGLPLLKAYRTNRIHWLSEENIERLTRLDPNFIHPKADFLLAVSGSYLQNHAILSGDFLAVQQSNTANSNQWVVFYQQNELVVQAYTPELQAQNPHIEGIVVGVIRSLSGAKLT